MAERDRHVQPDLHPNLTDGTSYTVALRGVSAAGVGAASGTLTATPFTYPDAPDASSVVGNGGNNQIAVSWAPANLNGGTLLDTWSPRSALPRAEARTASAR